MKLKTIVLWADKQKDELIEVILQQEDIIDQQKERIKELESRLNRNSQNSNKPPSTDQYEKHRIPKSQRIKTGRKTGAQPGHVGVTLQMVDLPDEIQEHGVHMCTTCYHNLANVQVSSYSKRQEYDIPLIKPKVIEHKLASKTCPSCKTVNVAVAPNNLTQSIQYGPNITTLASYLHYEQLIPLKRTQDIFEDVFHTELSEGTLINMHKEIADSIAPSTEHIAKKLQDEVVLNSDETSTRVNGKTNWLHVASNEKLTNYAIHKKRGTDAMNEIGILPNFNGVMVHDHWIPYFTYDIEHALCNAHHLRELQNIVDTYEQPWAAEMKKLLLQILRTVDASKEVGNQSLPLDQITTFSAQYDTILSAALFQIPAPKQPSTKKRGRIKQHPAKNLHDRLLRRKVETLRFMHDFNIPFTNNLAERDIRMTKVKQKISGGFRSVEGADRFCTVRSYTSTARKNGVNVMDALQNAIRGQPYFF